MQTSRTVLLVVLLCGCGNGASPSDAGMDAAPDARPDAGLLDPTSIVQFAEPLVVPPVMPPEETQAGASSYRIAVRRIEQQVLPSGMPRTTVFAYGSPRDESTFHFPGYTVEARTGEQVRVVWENQLVDSSGAFLPHILTIDPTLDWANPPGPVDSEGTDPYLGPVPIVTHLHGGHVADVSDGNPLAWFLPDAVDIPEGFAATGTHYHSSVAVSGGAVFDYAIDQRASTLWYHDHTFGTTRLNVYAGMAGFWLIRDAIEDALDLPGPAPRLGDALGVRHYEIPIVIQDRMFRTDGSLFYPDNRAYFDGFPGPYRPESRVPPRWNPEFFGNVMVVNGRSWPVLEVEPRLYRFRFLNGSNSRFLVLRFDRSLPFVQIGSDGGLLADAPVPRDAMLLGPGERADVLVDFSTLSVGEETILTNLGPDEPFGGDTPQEPADPATTGRVMLVRVVAPTGEGNAGRIPDALPAIDRLASRQVRDLTVNERMYAGDEVPIEGLLGTASDGPLHFEDDITETIRQGTTEIWRIANLTGDAHPIHLHFVQFQVLDRTPLDADAYAEAQRRYLAGEIPQPRLEDFFQGPATSPEGGESGWKDTFVAGPASATRIVATFDLAGLYVWHCHMLEHEDNEMMRPLRVDPPR